MERATGDSIFRTEEVIWDLYRNFNPTVQLYVYIGVYVTASRGDDLFSDWYILGPQTSKVLVR